MTYKVLIVEDDPMVAMINEQYVTKNHCFEIVGSCRNGQEALSFLSAQKVDLILLDVYMPVLDGVETLKEIRNRKIDSDVIMVTAANDTSTIENTMHLGVMDYLIKPFTLERFNISLEKFISKKNVLGNNQTMDQSSLDKLISAHNSIPESSEEGEILTPLPKPIKGIQPKTLANFKTYFENNSSCWNTVEMVAQELGISVVTARNYLNYLVKEKIILEETSYRTGGRPRMLYKYNN